MYLFSVAALVLLAFNHVRAQEMDEELLNNIICSDDESIRAAVLQCFEMMPSGHFEIIKACDPRVEAMEDDHGKIIEFYCSEKEGFEQVDECVKEAYTSKGMAEMKKIDTVVECFQQLMTKK